MKRIWVRPLRLYDDADKAKFIAAADSSGKGFPNGVFTLPSTSIMVAEMGSDILMYQPHFVPLELGSLITVGDLPHGVMAQAQNQLVAAAYTRAHSEGLAYLLASSENNFTRGFAMRHGFSACKRGLRMEIR